MRIRDIIHASGRQIRIGLIPPAPGEGALLQISDPSSDCGPSILLDGYGGDLLAGFLMSARLALAADLVEEHCEGPYGCIFRLRGAGHEGQVELRQHDIPLIIPALLWDRLYAELQLALAHGRHSLEAAGVRPTIRSPMSPRLLH